MGELTEDPFQAARLILTLRRAGITDANLLRAIETVPRSMFIAAEYSNLTYEDSVLPLPCGQTLEQPSVVAEKIQMLSLGSKIDKRVLLVGVGSGYTAALLSELASSVAGIERYRLLTKLAAENLQLAGIDSVSLKHGDGLDGWREKGPYDRILITGAVEAIPDPLLGQLAKNGFCVAPVIQGDQTKLIAMNADRSELNAMMCGFHLPLRAGVSKTL